MVACFGICTFGSKKCYLRRRIRPKVLTGGSKKCYSGEGNCHFRAQKSAISGETFAGASRGLAEVRWRCLSEYSINLNHKYLARGPLLHMAETSPWSQIMPCSCSKIERLN